MIDSLRVEAMLESAHRKITTMNMSKRDAIDLLTSWREMRAVVEALASMPDVVQWDNPNRCAFCGEWTLKHAVGCTQQKARALAGAAGGTEAL